MNLGFGNRQAVHIGRAIRQILIERRLDHAFQAHIAVDHIFAVIGIHMQRIVLR